MRQPKVEISTVDKKLIAGIRKDLAEAKVSGIASARKFYDASVKALKCSLPGKLLAEELALGLKDRSIQYMRSWARLMPPDEAVAYIDELYELGCMTYGMEAAKIADHLVPRSPDWRMDLRGAAILGSPRLETIKLYMAAKHAPGGSKKAADCQVVARLTAALRRALGIIGTGPTKKQFIKKLREVHNGQQCISSLEKLVVEASAILQSV